MFEKAGMVSGMRAGAELAADPRDLTKSKTAPGTMMGFLTAQSSAMQEADALKARVKSLERESPLQKLNPKTVKTSKWANRHEASFLTKEFQDLKAEIASAGGNVQPIKVRPVGPSLDATLPEGVTHELIYGHRRHRACLDLGIPVLAAVEETSDVSLFEQMERENRGRKNLSAWEQGTMYRKALDDGLYASLRRLADSLAVDVSLVSKSISLARLPETVVSAFSSPLDIQFRWAAPLAEAMQRDPDGTLKRARSLVEARGNLSAAEVFAKVIGLPDAVLNGSTPATLRISRSGEVAAKMTTDNKGRVVVTFEVNAFPESKRQGLVKAIEDFLKR